MSRYLICMALAVIAGSPCRAQPAGQARPPGPSSPPPPATERWLVSDTQIASVPARVAFPRSAGALIAYRHVEFSHEGEGIDNGIQYRSADGAVIGTVYIYFPGLAHGGAAALATDNAIRLNSTTPVTGGEASIVAAGGTEGLALRADYSGYRGMASSAAFIKIGRWIVKLRVSGPEARRAEVNAAMTAMLRGIEFGLPNRPRPATALNVRDCPAGAGERPARLLPDPVGAEMAAHGFLATFDGGGIEATDDDGVPRDLPSRLPVSLCVSSRIPTESGPVPILRAEAGENPSIDGRTMLLAMLSDSGDALEVVYARNLERYWLLAHGIGATTLLGSFDGVPSDAQIIEVVQNPDAPAGRARVPVRFRPGRGPEMYLPGVPAATPAPQLPST